MQNQGFSVQILITFAFLVAGISLLYVLSHLFPVGIRFKEEPEVFLSNCMWIQFLCNGGVDRSDYSRRRGVVLAFPYSVASAPQWLFQILDIQTAVPTDLSNDP